MTDAHPPSLRGSASYPPGLHRPHGFTLFELLVVAVVAVLLVATLLPLLRRQADETLRTISLKNLQVLGEAHACYAPDWEGRQFALAPRLLGTVGGDCVTYVQSVGCPNPPILGWDLNSAVWGFWLGCGLSPGLGSCTNLDFSRPIGFGTSDGAFRLGNVRGFQEYVGGRFYHPFWFSALDEAAYSIAQQGFDIDAQFPGLIGGTFAFSSYVLSPAALFNPDVFRAPSNGGFRDPDFNFDESYDTPTQDLCLHPSLKTRMIEHHWLVDPPVTMSSGAGDPPAPYFYNQGIDSQPGVLYFDGSVERMTMAQAVADDAAILKSSGGVDGLWSRDTPFGADGYFGSLAVDDTRNSFHILTTEGILGRDFLRRGGDAPRNGARR